MLREKMIWGGVDRVPNGTPVHVEPTNGNGSFYGSVIDAELSESGMVNRYTVEWDGPGSVKLSAETHWISLIPEVGDRVRGDSGEYTVRTKDHRKLEIEPIGYRYTVPSRLDWVRVVERPER